MNLLSSLAVAVFFAGAAVSAPQTPGEIQIRDPFVLPVPQEQAYYMYGTCSPLGLLGFDAYSSKDLQHWDGPFPVFRGSDGFWGRQDFWAPEVHPYRGKYYMFATFAKANPLFRGTQILVSESPRGPFAPVGDRAHTPPDWLSLDGTLYIDPEGQPWMVFCHEWLQVHDGEMCAMRLKADLSAPDGSPHLLFRASEAPWGKGPGEKDYVTDGPCLHRVQSGALLMLWSSFGKDGQYKVGVARSESGALLGPWTQSPEPLFSDDGGHPSLFRTFDGKLMLSLHSPNHKPERPLLLPVEERDNTLVLGSAHRGVKN